MRVNIKFSMSEEDDGFDGNVELDREGVEDLYTMIWFLSEAVRAAGFSYVKAIGAETSNGEVMFSDI